MDDRIVDVSSELLRLREELAALTKRVEALEETRPQQGQAAISRPAHPAGHRQADRQATISAWHAREYHEFLGRNPGIVQRLAEQRRALNNYLCENGFEPEPDEA